MIAISPKVSSRRKLKMDTASVKRREEYAKRSPEEKEAFNAKRRNLYSKNPEYFRAHARKWHEKNPYYLSDYYKEYYRVVGHDGGNSKRTKKVWDAHIIASQVPMEKYCELCPSEELRLAVMRHHPDYDYPAVFVSVCRSCHTAVHNDLKKQEQALEVCCS